MILTGKTEVLEKSLCNCHFVHHKSHTNWDEIESSPLWWQTTNQLPEPSHGQRFGEISTTKNLESRCVYIPFVVATVTFNSIKREQVKWFGDTTCTWIDVHMWFPHCGSLCTLFVETHKMIILSEHSFLQSDTCSWCAWLTLCLALGLPWQCPAPGGAAEQGDTASKPFVSLSVGNAVPSPDETPAGQRKGTPFVDLYASVAPHIPDGHTLDKELYILEMNKDNNVMKLTENDIKRRATEKKNFWRISIN